MGVGLPRPPGRARGPASRGPLTASLLLGVILVGGGLYLLEARPERGELRPVEARVESLEWRGGEGRRHLEIHTARHHLYYGGPGTAEVGARLRPGARIRALVRDHEWRAGVAVVEELAVDGERVVSLEERSRFYRRVGWLALACAALPLGYALWLARGGGRRAPGGLR